MLSVINSKAVIPLLLAGVSVLWYLNGEADPELMSGVIAVRLSLLVASISLLIALHKALGVKWRGFKDREVFRKFWYFMTLNRSSVCGRMYKARIYAQRATCPRVEFYLKTVDRKDNDKIYLFRSKEETEGDVEFAELIKRDNQKYLELIRSTYKVVSYSDIDIWTISYYDDLIYYLDDYKAFRNVPSRLHRLFVFKELDVGGVGKYMKYLIGNLCPVEKLEARVFSSGKVAMELSELGFGLTASQVKACPQFIVFFGVFALFVQLKLGISCSVINEDKFKKLIEVSSNGWELMGLGVFDDEMIARVYRRGDLCKYEFAFNGAGLSADDNVDPLFSDYQIGDIGDIGACAFLGLDEQQKNVIGTYLDNDVFLDLCEIYADVIAFMSAPCSGRTRANRKKINKKISLIKERI